MRRTTIALFLCAPLLFAACGDDRSVDEIVASGLDDLFSAGPPAAVLLAAPGRHLLLCSIPTGANPQEYLQQAATSDGPPQVAGGPPHFVNGMVDDLVVTDN